MLVAVLTVCVWWGVCGGTNSSLHIPLPVPNGWLRDHTSIGNKTKNESQHGSVLLISVTIFNQLTNVKMRCTAIVSSA